MTTRPTAAQALFPHLPRRSDEPRKQVQPNSLASAMYPALAEKTENEWREYNRKTVLPDLLDLNARRRERR